MSILFSLEYQDHVQATLETKKELFKIQTNRALFQNYEKTSAQTLFWALNPEVHFLILPSAE